MQESCFVEQGLLTALSGTRFSSVLLAAWLSPHAQPFPLPLGEGRGEGNRGRAQFTLNIRVIR